MACGYSGKSKTSQTEVEDWWDSLMGKGNYIKEEEIEYFYHCTILTGQRIIQREGKLIRGYTELPAQAPLASNENLKGVWLAMSPKELPKKSPYGTKRVVMKVGPLMTQLSTVENVKDVYSHDRYDAPSDDDDKRKGKGKKKEKKKEKKQPKKNQKEKHKVEENLKLYTPLLFFECAHYYGSTQYVRLVLIRQNNDQVEWCHQTLKEIDIGNNPFLCFKGGRIFYYTILHPKHEVFVETLVVGDINLETMIEHPVWDVVGKSTRAGSEPKMGVLW